LPAAELELGYRRRRTKASDTDKCHSSIPTSHRPQTDHPQHEQAIRSRWVTSIFASLSFMSICPSLFSETDRFQPWAAGGDSLCCNFGFSLLASPAGKQKCMRLQH
jgi:hypothetical protein